MEKLKEIIASSSEVVTNKRQYLLIPNMTKDELATLICNPIALAARGVSDQQDKDKGKAKEGEHLTVKFENMEIEEPDDEYELPGVIKLAISCLPDNASKSQIEEVRKLLREERDSVKDQANFAMVAPILQGHLSRLSRRWKYANRA